MKPECFKPAREALMAWMALREANWKIETDLQSKLDKLIFVQEHPAALVPLLGKPREEYQEELGKEIEATLFKVEDVIKDRESGGMLREISGLATAAVIESLVNWMGVHSPKRCQALLSELSREIQTLTTAMPEAILDAACECERESTINWGATAKALPPR